MVTAFFGTELYNQNVWQKVYIIMSIFMLIGIFATLSSSEPKIKKKLTTDNHINFLITILFSVISFISIYSLLDNPFEKEQVFLSFIFSFSRMVIFFISAFLIFNLFILIGFTSKKKITKSYLSPIFNFLDRYGKFAFLILMLISF